MATGKQMLQAVIDAMRSQPTANELRLSIFDTYDLCKLTPGDLQGFGLDIERSEAVSRDLSNGSLGELSHWLGTTLVKDKRQRNLIRGEGVRRTAGIWATSDDDPDALVEEIRRLRHPGPTSRMPFLLDTVICSASLKAQPEAGIHSRLIQYGGQLSVSRLSCAELYALGYRTGAKKLEQIDDLLNELQILEFDEACAREFGRLYARLQERGQNAGRADLMIAATAVVNGLVLVTHDSDFKPIAQVIPELRLDDWL